MPSIIPLRYRRLLGDRRLQLGALAVVLVLLPIYLFGYHWQPERVMERRWTGFLKAVETRNWGRVAKFLTDDYEDAWGQDAEAAVGNASQVLQGFLALRIEEHDRTLLMGVDGEAAEVSAVLILRGRAASYPAQLAQQRTAELLAPWEFTWVKTGGLPWSWQIRSVSNESLNLSAAQMQKLEAMAQEYAGE